MEEHFNYVKRTQRDYSMSLKLQVIQEIERGELSTHAAQRKYDIQARSTLVQWLRKYGKFDWKNQHHRICQRRQNKKSWILKLK